MGARLRVQGNGVGAPTRPARGRAATGCGRPYKPHRSCRRCHVRGARRAAAASVRRPHLHPSGEPRSRGPAARTRPGRGVRGRHRSRQAHATRPRVARRRCRLRRPLAHVLERPSPQRLHGHGLHHRWPAADHHLAAPLARRQRAVRPVRAGTRLTRRRVARLRRRDRLARHGERQPDRTDPVRPERWPDVSRHQPQVCQLPR